MSGFLKPGLPARWNRDPVVLLVDDEPAILGAIRRLLRNEPYEVITAGNCEEALGWLEELSVDLIITDQRMPGMSGTELLEVVRRRFPKTARVLLTGYRTPSTIRKGLETGAETFIYKPWSDDYLVETVRRLAGASARSGTRQSEPPASSIGLGGKGG